MNSFVRYLPLVVSLLLTSACAGCAPTRNVAKTPVTPAANAMNAEADLLAEPRTALATPQDAVVRVVGPKMTCTGSLIAEDLVLTAHHCVVERGERGEFQKATLAASRVRVELGGDYLPWGVVGLRAIVAPACGEAGGAGDIAVLVLERKLIGLSTVSARLDGAPRAGEHVEPTGFGRCALSPAGIRRRDREGGPIVSIGAGTFETDAAICPGDSGGPVVARATGDVVGVVSLSAMDADEQTRGRTVVSRLDGFRQVFAYAKAIADGADASDLPPIGCSL